jgi:hypothetical protein
VNCFWVLNAVVQVPAGGVLYAMVMFSLIGDLRMFEYSTGGGNCASTSNGAARRVVTILYCIFFIIINGKVELDVRQFSDLLHPHGQGV